MKKIYLSFLSLVLCVIGLSAQSADNRTISTIVADVLAQMPANSEADFNKQISDLASTGEEGILMIVEMMLPPGSGSNAAAEYALSGLSDFSTREGNERLKEQVERSYIKALDLTQEREIKAFIIRQLQIIGTDDSVEALAKFLGREDLSGPASSALANIGTEKATKVIQNSLLRRMGTPKTQRDALIAIGEAHLPVDENLLKMMIGTGDSDFQNAVLYAISRTGTKASLTDVEKTGDYEAYTALLKRVAEQGDVDVVEKAADNLLKDAAKANKEEIRIAAMEILLSIQKENGLNLVQKAMKDPSKEYRNSVLDFTSSFANENIYTEMVKTMAKSKPEAKVDILNWLRGEDISDLPGQQIVINQLKNKDFAVKEAAAWLLAKTANPEMIPVLSSLLTKKDSQTAELAGVVLASFNGDIVENIVGTIPQASDAGKVSIMELLALRKASDRLDNVIEQTKSESEIVRTAAYVALKDVVTDKNYDLICGMLEKADKPAIAPLQRAVISTMADLSKEEQLSAISHRMSQAGESKKHLYYMVVASTGVEDAFGMIVKAFTEEQGDAKESAFNALLSWRGIEAADELFAICKDPANISYFDRALDGYVRLISTSSLTAENKTIFLRNAMDIAKDDEQRTSILNRIGRTGTFQGMIYAAEFLDNESLQEAAANAVVTIALRNKDFNGDLVRDLIDRSSGILAGPEVEYQMEAIKKYLEDMPEGEGFVSIFNGTDLTGWKGLVENPIKRSKMTPEQLAEAQKKADVQMRKDWKVENGLLIFDGTGYDNICTEKQYGDFEMYVDWMLDPAGPEADAGIYLRGTPQVQMWDIARVNVGAQVGSGGLYNNQVNESKPLKVADNKLGEWNTMYIRMIGDRVTVYLNGELVTDNVILENYWDRKSPIFPIEQIELQAHGSKVYYRDIYVKELEREEPFRLSQEEINEGYKILFDGTNMFEWVGNTTDYTLEDGTITLVPSKGSGGNLYTKNEYDNFIFRFEFMMTPAANNGLGIRTPMEGDAAYVGMELQILDNDDPIYRNLKEYQYHGSVYGVIPAKRGFLKPNGEWNYQEVIADGDHIKITLNGEVILDGNIREASKNGTQTIDKQEHPGLLNKKGHIAFLGHGSVVKFKNIRIKEIK